MAGPCRASSEMRSIRCGVTRAEGGGRGLHERHAAGHVLSVEELLVATRMLRLTCRAATASFLRPLPVIESANVIAVQAHAAQLNWHRLPLVRKSHILAIHPPCESSENVVNCGSSLRMQQARQDNSLVIGQ